MEEKETKRDAFIDILDPNFVACLYAYPVRAGTRSEIQEKKLIEGSTAGSWERQKVQVETFQNSLFAPQPHRVKCHIRLLSFHFSPTLARRRPLSLFFLRSVGLRLASLQFRHFSAQPSLPPSRFLPHSSDFCPSILNLGRLHFLKCQHLLIFDFQNQPFCQRPHFT